MSGKDERGAELRELFFETAAELLQALNEGALQLEKTPADPEVVRSIRRTVHTLKGDAAACGYRELSELSHEMEDALALESASAHASLADVTFAAADVFTDMLAAYRRSKKVPDGSALRAMIRKLKDGRYRLYSRKKDPKTGKRRNLGTFATRAAAMKHERAVQFFKRGG